MCAARWRVVGVIAAFSLSSRIAEAMACVPVVDRAANRPGGPVRASGFRPESNKQMVALTSPHNRQVARKLEKARGMVLKSTQSHD